MQRGHRGDGRPETAAAHRRRAEQQLAELLATPVARRPRERWTVRRYADDRYLPSLTASPVTIDSYRNTLALYVSPHIGHIGLDALTADDVDDLDRALAANGYSLTTRRQARGALGRVLRHAKRKGRISYVVTDDADRLARDDRDRTRQALDPVQVRTLLASFTGTEWELPVALLALIGLRRGELLGLCWDAVDLDAGTLTVRRNLTFAGNVPRLGMPKTAGSLRTLDLSAQLLALLRTHRARQIERRLAAGPHWAGSLPDVEGQAVPLVFTDEAGRPITPARLAGAINRHADPAGLPHVHPHLLRHSVASVLIAQGEDVAAVGSVLGHASPAVTLSVYTHAFKSSRTRATGVVADAVGTW